MKIQILGARGEVESSDKRHRKHSGTLIDGQMMFDLGEAEFLNYHPKAIFITHLHQDHAYFVLDGQTVPANKIYSPEPFDSAKNILSLTEKVKVGSYLITPIPTIHSKIVKSQAYLIEKNGKRVLYTGDMIWIEKKHWKQFGKLDLVITDGSFIRKGGMVRKDQSGNLYGHTGIPNLVKFFAPYTHKILFVHFGSWFFKEENPQNKIRLLGNEKLVLAAGFDTLALDL